jgi:SAM-dependent methyltransferase
MARDYWQSAADDEAMQDEHRFIWDAMLELVDVDLRGANVLDAGCNRGGFLRLVADRYQIAAGYGFDPAAGAIEDARRLAQGRPLEFEAGDTVPAGWRDFDVAFSHEVIYLLHDLPRHARAMYNALRAGGVYYAVIGVHAGSPLMVEFHRESGTDLNLPPLAAIDDVTATFAATGYDVAVGRLPMRFVPVAGHGHHEHGRMLEWLDYYYEHKLVLRLVRPRAGASRQA